MVCNLIKVSALNRIQHKETRETKTHRGRTQPLLHVLQISLIPRCQFLIASSFFYVLEVASSFFYVLEVIKNWTIGRPGNDANANQVYSNLLLPHMTE